METGEHRLSPLIRCDFLDEPGHCGSRTRKSLCFHPEVLKHGEVEIWKGVVIGLIKGKVLAVSIPASSE